MRNLRKKNVAYRTLKSELRQDLAVWQTMKEQNRVDLCARFLLLPLIKKQETLSPETLSQTMPTAIDLERQASVLVENNAEEFSHLEDLLENTATLFSLKKKTSGCACC